MRSLPLLLVFLASLAQAADYPLDAPAPDGRRPGGSRNGGFRGGRGSSPRNGGPRNGRPAGSRGPRPSSVPERTYAPRDAETAAPVAPKRTERVDDFADFSFGKIEL